MKRAFWNKIAVFVGALLFVLVSGLTMAADLQWYVIKDVNGRCSVRQLKAKTAKTFLGPFADKEAAMKAKTEKCPKPETKEPAKKEPPKKP
jgi:hypothetical protein